MPYPGDNFSLPLDSSKERREVGVEVGTAADAVVVIAAVVIFAIFDEKGGVFSFLKCESGRIATKTIPATYRQYEYNS